MRNDIAFVFYCPLTRCWVRSIYRRSALHANLRGRYYRRPEDRRIRPTFGQIVPKSRLCTPVALRIYSAACSFLPDDQSVAAVMPAAHGTSRIFSQAIMQPASGHRRFVLAFLHINKGGTNRGPYLETECAGGVRCVCFRRRDCLGSILSSRGQRQRQTNNQ